MGAPQMMSQFQPASPQANGMLPLRVIPVVRPKPGLRRSSGLVRE
ncbi:hypothetical protein P3T40_007019 [Paraburkholderia sp. EB58]|jgi:hypothetical protein